MVIGRKGLGSPSTTDTLIMDVKAITNGLPKILLVYRNRCHIGDEAQRLSGPLRLRGPWSSGIVTPTDVTVVGPVRPGRFGRRPSPKDVTGTVGFLPIVIITVLGRTYHSDFPPPPIDRTENTERNVFTLRDHSRLPNPTRTSMDPRPRITRPLTSM